MCRSDLKDDLPVGSGAQIHPISVAVMTCEHMISTGAPEMCMCVKELYLQINEHPPHKMVSYLGDENIGYTFSESPGATH